MQEILNIEQTANAVAISGTANNALRVARTGQISNWKGIASPMVAFAAMQQSFLAKRGVTGPIEIFEGNKGFKDTIAGEFEIDWAKEGLEKAKGTIIKKFAAETHAQSALEGIMDLCRENDINIDHINRIQINIFGVAYHIIGGGAEGGKKTMQTKEQADHSLTYMIAVALLDGHVLPEQYEPERIKKNDVQQLLLKINIREKEEYSAKFPEELNVDIRITMKSGESFSIHKKDFEGFTSRPADWKIVEEKFRNLSKSYTTKETLDRIIKIIKNLEDYSIKDLMKQLSGNHKKMS